MLSRTSVQITTLIVVLIVATSCAGRGGPVAPDIPGQTADQSARTGPANRNIWGLWAVHIPADHQSATILPLRVAEMHLNATRVLENQPFSNCLKLTGISVPSPNLVSANLTLWHPFPGNSNLVGFDVRGIFISGADFTFPISGRAVAVGDGLPRLLNVDGYTPLFNPTEFPETQPGPSALKYFAGKFSTGGNLSATLNPFVAYARGVPRRMFAPGGVETRNLLLHVPDGPFAFGYAIDACWAPVPGGVSDPLNDFPPEANCLEAYKVVMQIGPSLRPEAGSWTDIQVEAWDHQGPETISRVTIEAPGLFAGELELDYQASTKDGSAIFAGKLATDLGAASGRYRLLARVEDTQVDPNLGPVQAWFLGDVRVKIGWAARWGGSGKDWANDCVTDEHGSIYITGTCGRYADLDPGPGIVAQGSSYPSIFLSKIDPNGRLCWAHNWGEPYVVENSGRAVALDGSGGVYMTGTYRGDIDFDPGPGVEMHSSAGQEHSFLSRFDADGNSKWARTWGPPWNPLHQDWCRAYDVALSDSGAVYVTGYFMGIVDFDPGAGAEEFQTSGYYGDIFLTKLSADGDFEWARGWGGVEDEFGSGAALDSAGNVLVVGSYYGPVDFDPGPGVDERTGVGGFLSRFDSSGNYQWARTWADSGYSVPYDIAIDSSDNIRIVGYFSETVDFDPGPGSEIRTSNGESDAFLGTYNNDGHLVSILTWGGSSHEQAKAVAIDGAGNIAVCGIFHGTVDFDPGPGINEQSLDKEWSGVYLTRFDSNGEYQWARVWGGGGKDLGEGVAFDLAGNIYAAGGVVGAVDFDPGPDTDHQTIYGMKDAFLSMFPPDGIW